MSARRFIATVLIQFWRRRENAPFFRHSYLALGRKLSSRCHYNEFAQSPYGYLKLWYAGVLKSLGFFYDSEYLYNQLNENVAVQALAFIGLGDLLLLEARWSREFTEYEHDGIAINPFGKAEKTWLGRQYWESIDTLSQALRLDPTNRDGWELLGSAYREIGLWKESFNCVRRHWSGESLKQLDAAEAAIVFGINRRAGMMIMKAGFGDQKDSEIVDAEIISSADLRGLEGVRFYEAGTQKSVSVKSNVVREGDILAAASVISFSASYVAHYKYAELLPRFGMLLVNGKYLVADSLHHKRCHWSLFTPSISAVTENRALIRRQAGPEYPYTDAIFIGHNKNYYHWIFDELPRLATLASCHQFKGRPILVDANIDGWQVELLERLGVDPSRLLHVDFRHAVRFRELIAPSHLSTMMVAHPDAVRFMRDRLVPHAASMSPRPGKRLYLARLTANERKSSLINERAVIERFKKAGFIVIDPGTMTITEQLDIFADADVIAGPGGAAMANALFAPAKAKLLELSSASMLCETFGSVAATLGQEHWWCAGRSYPQSFPAWLWTTFDYEISDRDIDLCFKHLL